MVNTNISPSTRIIDPRLDVPEGLSTFTYPDKPLDDNIVDANQISTDDSNLVDTIAPTTLAAAGATTTTNTGSISTTGLAVPDAVTVVSQTVKTSPSGQQLVDIVIDVTDVPGAVNYEVRITKI